MRKYIVLTLAALAATSLSTLALAGDGNQQKREVASAPIQMNDAEMGKVTAGYLVYNEAAHRYINSHAWRACGRGPIVCQ